ncbi:MAG: helix-turn-helix transcriptional regulator [Chloroflexi bacterium]|nr:helix-turn-helix transcriptional regulator [Chloroflexota bacterium]
MAVGGASADGSGTSRWVTIRPAHRRLVRRTIELMAGDPSAPLDLRSLAHRVGVSPYHLSRTFRRVVGLTLSRYHARLRVRAAIEGLLAGVPIAALAQEAGFADQSHLAHAVRAELDLTPGQLRRLGSS